MSNIDITNAKNLYITSDLHIGHGNIIKYCNRPYEQTPEGIAQMNEDILKKFDALPDTADTVVWNLGDVFFGREMSNLTIEEMAVYVNRMKGSHRTLVLILGNHDRETMNKNIKKFPTRKEAFEAMGFDIVIPNPVILFNKYILSHEPEYIDIGSHFVNLYGHTHDKLVDEDYFNRDEINGEIHPEYNKKVDVSHYKNMCLDANNFEILDFHKVLKSI